MDAVRHNELTGPPRAERREEICRVELGLVPFVCKARPEVGADAADSFC